MKVQRKYSFVIFFLLGLSFLLNSCNEEELPELSTSSITDITSTSAVGGGNITSDGNVEITSKGVCWSLEANPTTNDSKTDEGTGAGQFVSNINGLNAGTTYHVRAYATNSVGTAYGSDLSFTTLGEAPECITQTPINITSSGATLNGTVNANYLATTVTFEYGISAAYGQTVTSSQSPVSGNGITNVSADISGLNPGTTYHFRVIAVNSAGTANGNDLTFTTAVVPPTLTTTPVSNRTSTSVTTGGNITSDGGSSITAKGVCWATSPNPTINDDYTIDGEGSGSFTSEIKCLEGGTTYYVRAYATNSEGTGYGEQESFTTEPGLITFNPDLTYGTVMDIDGNCYKTIQIGDQVWMDENLRTSRYNDGSPIPNVVDNVEWGNLVIRTVDAINHEYIYEVLGAFCWYNNDSENFEDEYGKLYSFGVVESGKVCPTGWRVPSFQDWEILYKPYLLTIEDPIIYEPYPYGITGNELIERGITHWFESMGTNESGFTALPGGLRTIDSFDQIGLNAYFWSSGEISGIYGAVHDFRPIPLGTYGQTPMTSHISLSGGLSIRCIKDN